MIGAAGVPDAAGRLAHVAALLGAAAPAVPAGLAEAEVLRRLAQGLDNRSISGRPGKSE